MTKVVSTNNKPDPANNVSIAPQEIERKWKVNELTDLSGAKSIEILQGYVAIAADGTEVRLRQKGDKYFQTIKSDGGLVRGEIEVELLPQQFEKLWAATEGRRVEKTRYEISYNGAIIELDIYKGSLAGLLVAEVEFPSIRESSVFTPPSWFGEEITENKNYKNKTLATKGLPS